MVEKLEMEVKWEEQRGMRATLILRKGEGGRN